MTNGMTLMQASRQWATRPDDERFASLLDLNAHCEAVRDNSASRVVSSRALSLMPVAEGPDDDCRGLMLTGPNGVPVAATHWSFGQLCQLAGTPAGYMRELPAPLAADCLNFGLHVKRQAESVGVLLTKATGAVPELRAATGPNYGRIWNADITRALVRRFGDGLTGDWRVPGEFGQQVEIDKGNTTLFASDRDMFVFLCDEQNRITLPNRRDGKSGTLARGFFVWNSEVGKTSWGFAQFLFDYVCCNRIVWGAQEYHEIRGRHTANAPDRWLDRVLPAMHAFAHAAEAPIVKQLTSAQATKIGDNDKVIEFLNKRFSRTITQAVMATHAAEEGRPIESLWDASTAITAYARELPHQDARVDLEREAGRVLAMAA